MNFDYVVETLNKLLLRKKPDIFNSSWVLKHAPQCYRFIHKHVRTEIGTIDWDKITYALERKHQRRWVPGRRKKNLAPYRNAKEVNTLLKKNKYKMYVFIAPQHKGDRRMRDIISISLVRLAQNGNLTAQRTAMKWVMYTVDEWIGKYPHLRRWQGNDAEVQKQLAGCIRRYRYTGSFINYVFRTLELSARKFPPVYIYSLDQHIAWDSEKRFIDSVIEDPETGKARMYEETMDGDWKI